jgi:Flp pilus assembly protein TadD
MLRDKKGTEAVAALAPALEKAPRYAALHRTRAKALAVAGRDDEAMASADQAVQLDPRDWQNLYVRGIVRREKGDIAGAREDLQNALSLSPANAMVKKALDGLNAAPRP